MATTEPRNDALTDQSRIAGKAVYKGRQYLLVWEGDTKRGPAAKLAFTDGSKTFWVKAGEYKVSKYYQPRQNYRTHRSEYMTLGRLKRLREQYAKAKEQGYEDGISNGQSYTCEECGERVTRGEGSCWETGAPH